MSSEEASAPIRRASSPSICAVNKSNRFWTLRTTGGASGGRFEKDSELLAGAFQIATLIGSNPDIEPCQGLAWIALQNGAAFTQSFGDLTLVQVVGRLRQLFVTAVLGEQDGVFGQNTNFV